VSVKYTEISCACCGNQFQKLTKHYKWELKKNPNHTFYCSRNCIHNSRSEAAKVSRNCLNCGKEFESTSAKKSRKCCSKSCASEYSRSYIDYTKVAESLRKYDQKECPHCNLKFYPNKVDQTFCSSDCHYINLHGRDKFDKDSFISELIEMSNGIGTRLQKREVPHYMYSNAVRLFGSWNVAVEEAGLVPNDRKYVRNRYTAKDGHIADSLSELVVDNFLYDNGVKHDIHVQYPFDGNYVCDFYLPTYDVWVEYFGLYDEIDSYTKDANHKIKTCDDNGLTLISIFPRDLYPNINLNSLLSEYICV